MSTGDMAVSLESYADGVALILERYGVFAVRPEPRARFDPRRHRATETMAAAAGRHIPDESGYCVVPNKKAAGGTISKLALAHDLHMVSVMVVVSPPVVLCP